MNIYNLRHPRRDWALVGAAGPASNIAMALACSALLSILIHTGVFTPLSSGSRVLVLGIFANALLAVFNLIPIPPLDGSRVIMYFLSEKTLRAYVRLENFGIFIILFLFFYVPPFRTLLWSGIQWVMLGVTSVFGVAPEAAQTFEAVF